MVGIPAIRARLHEIADETGIEELHELAEATKRRRPLRRYSAKKYPPLNSEQAEFAYGHYMFKGVGMHEIALTLKTNIGRVSEAIHEVSARTE